MEITALLPKYEICFLLTEVYNNKGIMDIRFPKLIRLFMLLRKKKLYNKAGITTNSFPIHVHSKLIIKTIN
jgi:hypothetical protein